MLRRLDLQEQHSSEPIRLSVVERDILLDLGADLNITPVSGTEDSYEIRAGSTVGAIQVGSLAVRIRPKLAVSRVLFLLSYAFDPDHWLDTDFDLAEERDLLEAIVPGFVAKMNRAISRGILQGYRVEEDALNTIRGRVRFDEQLRRWQGVVPPVEVRFDEYTIDIDENRLLRAAVARLEKLRLRSPTMRLSLARSRQLLNNVSIVHYVRGDLPDITWSRLNERYRPAIGLAKLILQTRSWELEHGSVTTSAFLVDMNKLFEDFVVTALREKLRLDPQRFPQGSKRHPLYLDISDAIRLRPDISWWEAGRCLFVGDAKYKRINVPGIKHADIYQLLAYCIASRLEGGLLIYAKGEGDPARHVVRHLGRELHVVALDLEMQPEGILSQFDEIADLVLSLRAA
jgi:5-methylcytosine-specific restriction enzyme subunit McrC